MMGVEQALFAVAATVPITAFALKFFGAVTPVQFVKLETEFSLFREEIRHSLDDIKTQIEKTHE